MPPDCQRSSMHHCRPGRIMAIPAARTCCQINREQASAGFHRPNCSIRDNSETKWSIRCSISLLLGISFRCGFRAASFSCNESDEAGQSHSLLQLLVAAHIPPLISCPGFQCFSTAVAGFSYFPYKRRCTGYLVRTDIAGLPLPLLPSECTLPASIVQSTLVVDNRQRTCTYNAPP